MTVVSALAALAGAVAGGWMALGGRPVPTTGRWGSLTAPAVVAALGGVAVALPGSGVVASPLVGVAGGWATVTAVMRSLQPGAVDTCTLLGLTPADRRRALARELRQRTGPLAGRGGAAVAGAVLVAGSSPLPVVGTVLAVLASVGARLPAPAVPARADGALLAALHLPPGEGLVVIETDQPASAYAGPGVEVVTRRPHMFRAPVGWNLGLGLDAEQACWAAQLACSIGVGELGDPAGGEVDDWVARSVAVCRGLAGDAGTVVLDRPLVGISASQVRQLVRLIGRHADEKRIVVLVERAEEAAVITAAAGERRSGGGH